ncbi:MAG: penicillin-binding protein 2 [Gammaproteobacteria bacterium]|nr:MAG: penicillin-binding protein 2 [Gammaproteobacteria bacterium]
MPAVRIKDHWREQHLFDQRALFAGALIALLTVVLLARLFVLQVLRHDYYAELSQGNRVRTEPIPAVRGLILDRNAEVIADNQPAYQLELVPEEVPDLKGTLKGLVALALIRSEDLDELLRTIRSRRSFDSVPIRLRMSDEDVARFAVRRFEFPGLDIKTRQTRSYPHRDLAVHALGYVGAISEQDLERIDPAAYSGTTLIGKLGVESAFEKPLHGTNGLREILVNAQGRSVARQGAFIPSLRTKAPTAGDDVLLSLDLKVQRVAEEALRGHRGAVVALDPNNGDVIALASMPGFDPNLFGRGITTAEFGVLQNDIDRPLFNRALRGAYPPGSTVKPVIALAGLTYHVVDPQQRRFCAGVFHLPGSAHLFREGKGGKHGSVDLEDAIARSCDVYFYGLADVLGVDRIAAFMAPFGFGKPTGIDIGGEKPGLLPSRQWKAKAFARAADRAWFPGETVNFGIGQGYLSVTPLQLAHYVSVIASRGKVWKPRLVSGLRDTLTGRLQRIPPVPDREVTGVDPEDWRRVVKGMIGATTRGTAAAIGAHAAYSIAGKTGTAQVFSVGQNEKYNAKDVEERLRDHSWFIAFAPAEAPRIALAVLEENGGWGASAAAPIARKVMDAYLLGPDGKLKPAPIPTGAPAAPPSKKQLEPTSPSRPPEQKQADTRTPPAPRARTTALSVSAP